MAVNKTPELANLLKTGTGTEPAGLGTPAFDFGHGNNFDFGKDNTFNFNFGDGNAIGDGNTFGDGNTLEGDFWKNDVDFTVALALMDKGGAASRNEFQGPLGGALPCVQPPARLPPAPTGHCSSGIAPNASLSADGKTLSVGGTDITNHGGTDWDIDNNVGSKQGRLAKITGDPHSTEGTSNKISWDFKEDSIFRDAETGVSTTVLTKDAGNGMTVSDKLIVRDAQGRLAGAGNAGTGKMYLASDTSAEAQNFIKSALDQEACVLGKAKNGQLDEFHLVENGADEDGVDTYWKDNGVTRGIINDEHGKMIENADGSVAQGAVGHATDYIPNMNGGGWGRDSLFDWGRIAMQGMFALQGALAQAQWSGFQMGLHASRLHDQTLAFYNMQNLFTQSFDLWNTIGGRGYQPASNIAWGY
jgi:hypothetical protein